MNELIKKAVEKIVHIPHDHYNGNKSELTLLKESGYFELHDQINEDEITGLLKMHPHLIADWLQMSEDSRSSTKWVFGKGEDGKYGVGHWPPGKEFKEIITTDKFYACAAFIKRDIESTRVLFKDKINKAP